MTIEVAEIGESLRQARVVAGLKQGDVAQAAGLTPWRLLKIEKSLVRPTPEEVGSIKDAIKRLGTIETQRRVALGVRKVGAR